MLETKEILDTIQKAAETIAAPNCAAWLSAVATVGAVTVAIIVAVKQNNIAKKQNEIILKQADIAKKQNEIALFEKKYAVYNICTLCISFLQSINGMDDTRLKLSITKIRELFIVSFSCYPTIDDPSEKTIFEECTRYAINAKNILDTASFLFSCDVDSYTKPMIKALFDLLYCTRNSEIIDGYCKQYQTEVLKLQDELLPEIKHELRLYN